jgi:hypothetical protein
MNEEYLWSRGGEPDDEDAEIARLERVLGRLRYRERPLREPRWTRLVQTKYALWWLAAAAAVLVVGVVVASMMTRGAVSGWQFASGGRLRAGDLIEAGKIESDATGEVRVDSGSRLRLTREDTFNLERGTIHAFIWAPPGKFVVDTPSAKTIDLGCRYTLQVSQNGTGLLKVEMGWVAFESRGVESFIPAGAACVTRPVRGPGTPYFMDASPALTGALERFDNASDAAALEQAIASTRARDALTLWHLLTRTRGEQRAEVYTRFAAVVNLPREVSRDAILRGDPAAFDAAWNALDLGDTNWWRGWKRQW